MTTEIYERLAAMERRLAEQSTGRAAYLHAARAEIYEQQSRRFAGRENKKC